MTDVSPWVRFLDRTGLLAAFDAIVPFVRLDGHPFELSRERGRFYRAWTHAMPPADPNGFPERIGGRERAISGLRIAARELKLLGSVTLFAGITARRQSRQAMRAATVLWCTVDPRPCLQQTGASPDDAMFFAVFAANGRGEPPGDVWSLVTRSTNDWGGELRLAQFDADGAGTALRFLADRLDPPSAAQTVGSDASGTRVRG